MADEPAVMDAPEVGGAESVVSTPGVSTEQETPVTAATTPEAESGISDQEGIASPKEEDLAEFKGLVARQVVGLVKDAPELKDIFAKYPKVESAITAAFRRDAAQREIFPTIAEAREIRSALPNGLEDLKEIQQAAETAERLDGNFVARDQQGNFPGHAEIIRNMREMDQEAFGAMVRTGIQEWSKTDPEGYSATFSNIIGATFQSERVFGHIAALQARVKDSTDEPLKQAINELAEWVNNFNPAVRQQREPSPEEQRLRADRESLRKEREQANQQNSQRFNSEATVKSTELQKQVIEAHPLIKKLPANIPPHRRQRIINDVQLAVRQHLANTPRFMAKLKDLWQRGDLQGVIGHQKNTWSQPWLLNKYVRKVLADETPQVVQASRTQAATRVVPSTTTTAKSNGTPAAKKAPYQVGRQWYKANGTPFKTEEILAGRHLV